MGLRSTYRAAYWAFTCPFSTARRASTHQPRATPWELGQPTHSRPERATLPRSQSLSRVVVRLILSAKYRESLIRKATNDACGIETRVTPFQGAVCWRWSNCQGDCPGLTSHSAFGAMTERLCQRVSTKGLGRGFRQRLRQRVWESRVLGVPCPYSLVLALLLMLATGCQHPSRPFYPVGIYSVPKADLPLVRQAGFNLVTGPAEKSYLDSAGQLGLKVLASPGTSAGKRFDAGRARQVLAQLDGHPALWAWSLVDEPDLNGVSPDEVKLVQRFVKTQRAHKPTALVLYQGGEALNYANIADLTMIDRYPIPWLPLANFPQHIRMARLALGQDKPLIAVIQAFDWGYYPKLLSGGKNLRPPTYEELRCMTYCALARRATGLFYYCFDDGAWKLKEAPARLGGCSSCGQRGPPAAAAL